MDYLYEQLKLIKGLPALRIGEGTLPTLEAFISGYCDRQREIFGANGSNIVLAPEFQDFVGTYYGVDASKSGWVSLIMNRCGDGHAAFFKFYELLDVYLDNKGVKAEKLAGYRHVLDKSGARDFHAKRWSGETLPRFDSAKVFYGFASDFLSDAYLENRANAHGGVSAALLSEAGLSRYLACPGVAKAFEKLADGRTDIVLSARTNEAQRLAAVGRGLEMRSDLIAKDALVFVVSAENPVKNLTMGEAKMICSRDLTNWREVGGRDEPIHFHQLEDGLEFAVQEIFGFVPAEMIMREEIPEVSSEPLRSVVDDKNALCCVAFSRIARDGTHDGTRTLSVDGAAATDGNVTGGLYPLMFGVYAVTATNRHSDGCKARNIREVVEGMSCPRGQALLKKAGHVPLNLGRDG
ncbi:MAG: substrate-binding domain-containing protein [Clostridiales Family XIII bacterium]|jgi:phosphate transport system substrate-binding protein|nr:substrate-binding domain-containing protein [Clostridiales Family XIII bacterium]